MATKAVWNGAVIAATDTYETVEGNVYFPPSSVNMQYVKPSSTNTNCPWKGQASYYTLVVDGQENKDAAWYYPAPKPAASNIKDYVAFWRGVKIEKAAAQAV
ncbi:unnamed protein product [Sphagnum balticum]